MGFETLLGNDRLKKNLTESLAKGHISHFYLISGPKGSGKHTLARLLAAGILCSGSRRPCCSCGPCRKVLEGLHPDVITVDDPEKKTVSVDLVRSARADIYVKPNESAYKVYLIPRAQDMGTAGQNALLKVLEEPPEYGVFILLADNPDKLLVTVRSRCTELKLQALPEPVLTPRLRQLFPAAQEEQIAAAIQRSGGFLGQAAELLEEGNQLPPQTEGFVKAFAEKDHVALAQVLVPMEKWSRESVAETLNSWLELVENAMVCRAGIQAISPMARKLAAARSSTELYDVSRQLKKALEYVSSNVSVGAVCGYLSWYLR